MAFKFLIIFPCIVIHTAFSLGLAFLLVLDHWVSFAIYDKLTKDNNLLF